MIKFTSGPENCSLLHTEFRKFLVDEFWFYIVSMLYTTSPRPCIFNFFSEPLKF